ncbi:hypothetical protein [Endozoicomonas lisbonensis]|uniref:Uncharacterized protein n=1 Tax=Endozoicomonas lisbonensis TaxID=3120522 RepID=A0ABV2SCD1_9GAMM
MSSTLSPEHQIVNALVDRLKSTTAQVLLGYSATGVEQDLTLPSLLVQLESITEQTRNGTRAKYQMQFILSAVVPTDENTTYELLNLVRSVRESLNNPQPLCEQVRQLTFSETQFDIAPGQGHLSFADMTLTIEAIF